MKNILVVDDSALMRRVVSDIINNDEQLHTEMSAANGREAMNILERGERYDVIVLDINMPVMNGLEFLKELNRKHRKDKVIIVSTIAKEGAKETILALEMGAFDFVTKPDSLREAKGETFSKRLLERIYAAAGLGHKKAAAGASVPMKGMAVRSKSQPVTSDRSLHVKEPLGKEKKKLVALACSTGGPKALQYVIPFLPENLNAPVLLVQHMPAGFTASLSTRLDELSRIHVKEAQDGEVIRKGTVYIAKGGSQMRLLEKNKSEHTLSVRVETARNGLMPCADIMYESLLNSGYDEIICVIMTGMGADGTKGILQLEKTNKIYVIAQDEQTSTVYGMPKAIADAGAVDEVHELKNIADAITKHVGVL